MNPPRFARLVQPNVLGSYSVVNHLGPTLYAAVESNAAVDLGQSLGRPVVLQRRKEPLTSLKAGVIVGNGLVQVTQTDTLGVDEASSRTGQAYHSSTLKEA